VIFSQKHQMAALTLEGMLLIRSGRVVLQRHGLSAIGTLGIFDHRGSYFYFPADGINSLAEGWFRMPFRNYSQFDSAALKVMTAAYDAVVARLQLKSDDPLTGKLAAKIASLAAEGERDVGKLTEQALLGLK
jgi:hypothetical protein